MHAETLTGAHQPLEEISKLIHDAGALLLVDAVTSLGGVDLRIDDWKIDACYSGTQKCLCPPGLSPMTFSPNAIAAMDKRKTKVQSWYLDVSMLRQYWGEQRVYHHTAPINMNYAVMKPCERFSKKGWKSGSPAIRSITGAAGGSGSDRHQIRPKTFPDIAKRHSHSRRDRRRQRASAPAY